MPVAAAALIPAAAGVISSAIEGFGAASQEKKDKRDLSNLATPFYKIQKEYGDIENSAAQTAQGGLTVGAKDYYSDLAGRGLGTAVSATNSSNSSPNDINRIFQTYNDSIGKLAADDSEAQIKNIQYYNQAAKDVAAQKNIQFGINEYQPYQNKLKELTQRIAADKLNIHNSINAGIGDIQAGVTSNQNQQLLDKLFKNKDTGETPDPFTLSTIAKNFNFNRSNNSANNSNVDNIIQ